jgi:hypothetical protein
MSHDPLVLAYLAGIIDADGYVTVQRSRHRSGLYYGAKIGIAGTRREPHDLAASLWGGAVSCYRPKNGIHLPQFQWSRSGRVAGAIILDLLPYLRVKQEQARVALELDEHVDDGRAADPYPWFGPHYDPKVRCEDLFLEAKALNLRKPRGRLLDGVEHNGMPRVQEANQP